MEITFPGETCAVTRILKTFSLLKRQFINKTGMKGICLTLFPFQAALLAIVKNDLTFTQ